MRAVAAALLVVIAAAPARAAVRLCVALHSDEDAASVRTLVMDELAHHPSHEVVTSACQSTLAVELFTVGGVHFLTARIDREVPVRYTFKDARDLAPKLTEAIALSLDHDPVYLATDPTRLSTMQRMANSLLVRGHNVYRLEVYGVVSATGDGTGALASGGAFTIARGADHWQAYVRAYGGGSPSDPTGGQVLRLHAGADGGFAYELSARAFATPYVALGLGLQMRRFEGPLAGGKSTAAATQLDPVAVVRVGVRALRIFDFDVDAFAQGYLPLYGPDPQSSPLAQAWSPSLIVGMGVGL